MADNVLKTYTDEKVSTNKKTADLLMAVSGAMVSHHIYEADVVNSDRSQQYFMTFDGPALRRTEVLNLGSLVITSKADTVPGLPALVERIQYTPVKKIPGELLRGIMASFKAVYDKHGTESACQIYRKADDTYFVYYPKQKVFPAHVDYSGDDKAKFELRQVHELVMELHSHCNMGAFFSGGDDANEKFPCLFTVIGQFGTPKAAIRCRVKFLDMKSEIPFEELFDTHGISADEFMSLADLPEPSKELLDNVTTGASVTTYTYSGYTGNYKGVTAAAAAGGHSMLTGAYTPSNYRYNGSGKNWSTVRHTQPTTYYEKATTPLMDLEWIVDNLTDDDCNAMLGLIRARMVHSYVKELDDATSAAKTGSEDK